MAFPSLSVNPTYPYSVEQEDDGIKSESEFGYIHGRRRFTKTRKVHSLRYEMLTNADKALLEAHIREVGTYTTFTWTDPFGSSHTVRYVQIPRLTNDFYNHWSTEFELREV
jgi:hypothetical protein